MSRRPNRMSDPTPPILSSTTEYYRPVPAYAARPPRPRYWLHALLLVATCFTTLVMGARMQYNFVHGQPPLSFSDEPIGNESIPYFPAAWLFSHPARLLGGIPFAATVMLFFLAPAFLYSDADTDRNHGRGHPDSLSDSLTDGAV